MLQNGRPYQLIHSKTHSRTLAGAAGLAARVCGAAGFGWQTLTASRSTVPAEPAAARTALEQVYPKPVSDTAPWPPLPAVDPAVDLSVIVPAHNAEKTLDTCLQSILQQQTRYTIQLIAVDSASTDRTSALLQAYCGLPNVVLTAVQEPSSAATARNAGLLHAVGRYLMFVDSDDMLLPGAVQALLDTAEQQQAEVVQGGWQYLYENEQRGPVQTYAAACYTGPRAVDRFDLPGMPWGKVYRRELFAQVRFPSGYRCFEDAIIHFLVFRQAQKVVSVPQTVYLWRKNPQGLTSTSQHRPAAVQSYWIVEELLAQDAALGLPHDTLFAASLTMQLSNFCYATIAGLAPEVQRTVFTLCCALYAQALPAVQAQPLPYRARCGANALRSRCFALWCAQGRLFPLL